MKASRINGERGFTLDANQPWSEISVHGCFGVEIMLSSAHMQEISKHFGENKMMEDALRRYYQRFGESLRLITDDLDHKNIYAFNPDFDKQFCK